MPAMAGALPVAQQSSCGMPTVGDHYTCGELQAQLSCMPHVILLIASHVSEPAGPWEVVVVSAIATVDCLIRHSELQRFGFSVATLPLPPTLATSARSYVYLLSQVVHFLPCS
jgi:hypothetical protein